MDKKDINKQIEKLDKEFTRVFTIYTSFMIALIIFAFILNMPIMIYFLLNFLALGNFFFNSHIY